jgi:uncharacterized protein involved in exopolysaccharide biosynthesis
MTGYDNGYGNGRGNGNGNGGPQRQPTLREFAAILFRRKWIVVGLFVATTVTVLVTTLSTPTSYISAGSVYVKSGERQSILQPGRQLLDDWEQALATEMEIVKSQAVIERAQEILAAEAGDDTLQLDAGQIDVEVRGKSNVMAIGYVDRDGDVARTACDAVLRAYVEFRQRDFALAYPRQFFEAEIAEVEADLERTIAARRDYVLRTGAVSVGEQSRELIGHLGVLQQRRTEVEADLAEAVIAQRQMEEIRGHAEADLATFSALYNEGSLLELKRRILDQEARLAGLRERLQEDALDVVNTRKTLETLQGMLQREIDARIQISSSRTEMLRARLAVIDRDLGAAEAQLQSMPDKESRLALMDKEIEVLKNRYSELTERSDQAKVTENTSSSVNVLLLEPAGAPKPVNARDYVRLALAPAFSIVVGIGLAFFVDGLDLTVRTAGHAEEAAELPVLASLTERRRRTPAS